MSWILSFDLGIGNGLRNKLVESLEKKVQDEVKSYISSAYITISVIVFIIIISGYTISSYVNWNDVFNISENIISKKTMLFMMRSVFVGVMLQFLLKLIFSILYALQKSVIPNFIALITSAFQLMFVLIYPIHDLETNLKMISLAYVLTVNIPLLITTLIIFRFPLKGNFPSIEYFSISMAKVIITLGGAFFWVQIMFMIISNTNEFIISQLFGPEYVVDYQIYNRLFTLVGTLSTLALTPLWSAITKAFNEKDHSWLVKTYKRMNYMVIIAIVLELSIIPFINPIISIWIGNGVLEVNYAYAIIFALYGSVFIYQSVLSTIACGIGKLKLQILTYTFGVVFKFLLIYIAARIWHDWIIVLIVNIVVLLPYCILQPIALSNSINSLKPKMEVDFPNKLNY